MVTHWHAYAGTRGGGGVAPTHLQPGSRRRCVISTTLRPLYPEKVQYPLERRLGGPRDRCVVSTTLRPLYPREGPGIPFTGTWVGLGAGLDKTLGPGFDSRTVQHVASHYAEYAIPATMLCSIRSKCWFFSFPAWPISVGPTLGLTLCQRCVVLRASGRFNSRWRELDKPSHWQ
jgi:hypothetical protein